MLKLIPSSPDRIEAEKNIMNSNPYYNRISKDKEELSAEEIGNEIIEARQIGAERFVIQAGDHAIGIIEYLMNNPSDGYPWLGLLVIKQEYQSRGYGQQALRTYYKIMADRQVKAVRIGVILDNEPAHRFWRKQGFAEVTSSRTKDNKEVVVYEKNI